MGEERKESSKGGDIEEECRGTAKVKYRGRDPKDELEGRRSKEGIYQLTLVVQL